MIREGQAAGPGAPEWPELGGSMKLRTTSRGARAREAGLAMTLLLCGVSTDALAQAAAPAASKPSAGPHAEPAEAADDATVSELVITADPERPQPGAVVGDIKPEIQLSPAEIQSYGVSS